MSLLEDIFLRDEAYEAQELERVIEGDENDEKPRSRSATPDSDANSHKDDEAEEDKRRVDPSSTKTRHVTKNPRFILNPARLTGPRGIQVIPDHFKDFKFEGRGHEKEACDIILKKLEHWAYRLYPKFQFEDCLKKIETLGKKRPVMVHLHKIRTDQFMSEDTVVQKDSSDEETAAEVPQEEDEFDKLLQQQIEIARATPAPNSVKKVMDIPRLDRSPFTMPKATSSPSISDEQKERMMRNRKLAEERRLARLKQNSMDTIAKDNSKNISQITEMDEENVESIAPTQKTTPYQLTSDEEYDYSSFQQDVRAEVHNTSDNNTDVHIDKNKTKNVKTKVQSSKFNKTVQMDNDLDEIVEENSIQNIRYEYYQKMKNSVTNKSERKDNSSPLNVDFYNRDDVETPDAQVSDFEDDDIVNVNETPVAPDPIKKDHTDTADAKQTVAEKKSDKKKKSNKNKVTKKSKKKDTKTRLTK